MGSGKASVTLRRKETPDLRLRCRARAGAAPPGESGTRGLPHALHRAASRGWPLAACAVLCACAGPTAPSPTSVLTITAPSALLVGQTAQLTAADATSGVPVTEGLTWRSMDDRVAKVSAGGLLTAVGEGTTRVSASTGEAAGSALVFVQQSSTATTVLSACQSVLAPGTYVLNTDLSAPSEPCLALSNVAGVTLDCRGHAVAGLLLSDVGGSTIRNCVVAPYATIMRHVSATTLTGCVCDQTTVSRGSSGVVILDSTISTGVSVLGSSDVELRGDTISTPGAGVYLSGGRGNRVLDNTITGGYDGSAAHVGADDGILTENETGDTIEDNRIEGFFDAAIEGLDALTDTTIADNDLSGSGESAIFAYWCTSWTGNTIRGNRISMSASMVTVGYQASNDHCGANPPSKVFVRNQFVANVFRSAAPGVNNRPVRGPRMGISMQGGMVSGNVIAGNDLGTYDGPLLYPLSGFIDGGGNICGPQDPKLSNFPCTGGGVAPREAEPTRVRRRMPARWGVLSGTRRQLSRVHVAEIRVRRISP
jgi:parallel beta-helix repeat protein